MHKGQLPPCPYVVKSYDKKRKALRIENPDVTKDKKKDKYYNIKHK